MFNDLINKRTTLIVFIISLIFCTIGIGWYPIYILDEAKNAEAAREMLSNSEFIIPTFNDALRTDKPPLHYYFMMIGYKLLGVNAFGARFFSGVFGAITMAVSFHFVKKFASQLLACVYIIVLWSSIFFIQEFHLAVPDPYLICFISSGLWCFYDFYKTQRKRSLWLIYILLGLGILTKGPVAIALPGLICLLFFISTKSLSIKTIAQYKPFIGTLILLAVALPWYMLVHYKTDGAWTQGFFIDHNVNRFGNKMEGHGGIFLITWAFVLLGLMPFSFFIIHGFKQAYKHRKTDDLLLFSAIVSAVFIVFFSISGTKLPNYTMPCYPFLVFVLSKALLELSKTKGKRTYITPVIVLITLLAVALPIAGKFALLQEKALAKVSNTAFWLIPTALLTLIGTIFFFRKNYKNAFLSIASGWILLTPILFLFIYPKLNIENPAQKAKNIIKNTNQVAAYKRFDAAFPFNFKQTYSVLKTEADINAFFDRFPNGYLITNHKKATILTENHDNLIMIFEGKALFELHTTRIFRLKSSKK